MSDSLTVIYVEPHQCPSHHAILLTQERICEIFTKKFSELAILKIGHLGFFFSEKKNIFAWSPWKSVTNYVLEWMDGNQFWCFPWFPANSLLCVIYRYTVYFEKINWWWTFNQKEGPFEKMVFFLGGRETNPDICHGGHTIPTQKCKKTCWNFFPIISWDK